MKYFHTFSFRRLLPALAFICLCLFPASSTAQVYGDKYESRYDGKNTSNLAIQHKKPKWYSIRESAGLSAAAKEMDTFDDANPMTTNPWTGTQIQSAHAYVDTIYMKKGSSIELTMPSRHGTTVTSIRSYQRWYNYRTEGTFRTTNSSRSSVYDLLTPADSRTAYRFENGYVGNPLVNIVYQSDGTNDFTSGLHAMDFYFPTDAQYSSWGSKSLNRDNDLYIVAVDVSCYLDFSENFSSNSTFRYSTFLSGKGGPWEPTLSQRVIFYIYGVDSSDEWPGSFRRLQTDNAYQLTGSNAKYLEEYEITFPIRHVSNKTDELVALSKDANAWVIPGAGSDNAVTVTLTDNTAGITLNGANSSGTLTLSGASRIIQFKYPTAIDYGMTMVNGNNTTATILVRKGKYNLARYKLTFLQETLPLTQQQIANLDNGTVPTDSYYYFPRRTPKYLREHYRLLTSLDFEYDQAAANTYYGSRGYYPFPLQWDNSSYAFYDGAPRASYPSSFTHDTFYLRGDFIGQNASPQWGYYVIMNNYNDIDYGSADINPPTDLGKDPSTYHLFVDASDRPGTIARLTFPEKLCNGSELFVSAWIKSAGNQGSGVDDAAVLFTVMGVRTVDGRKVYTPIYRHSSSQIRKTQFLDAGIPGCGAGNNQWMQVYFSFINEVPAGGTEFEEYALQIDNNCASTSGGDFFIDDIQVYIQDPTADVTQLEATCTGQRTLMNVSMDWERLTSRLGDTDATSGEDAIDFCFIDKTVYDDYLAEHPGEEAEALKEAAVNLGPDSDHSGNVTTFYFTLPFESNNEYDETNVRAEENLAANSANVKDGKYYFRRAGTVNNDDRRLTLNFYSDLKPFRPYYMLIREHRTDGAPELSDFVGVLEDECGMFTSFSVSSTTLVKVNGEIVNPTTDFCAGQIFDFTAQVRVPYVGESGEEEYFSIEDGIYFDWFFGSEDDFLAAHNEEEYGGESLAGALDAFRAVYPEAEAVGEDTPWGDLTSAIDGATVKFTEGMYNLLVHYSTVATEGALNPPLVLHRERLNIKLLESGLQLVIKPIQAVLPPDDLPDGVTENWARICWEYIPLVMTVTNAAPELHAGFNTFYPTPDFNPALRIGLTQIRELSDASHTLNVSLRGAKLVTDGAADHLSLITTEEGYDKLFLIGTDDPAYQQYFTEDFDQMSLPIGTVTELYAQPYTTGSDFDDHMDIWFDLSEQENGFQFQPREGYTYTFCVHFEERSNEGDGAIGTACYGQFNVDMKVVPEYVVWNGSDTDNWNNDEAWRRAEATDFNHTGGDYTTNDANGTDQAFVPMLFTKVIVPRDKRIELYRAGVFGQDNNGQLQWDSDRPAHIGPATENIEYDLMTYQNGTAWSTERYRVTLCDQIHLEPGAELLHAEQLIHNKAWTDVELTPKQWNLVSTPLKGVYAGDWYTQTTGCQATEYFKDITFTGEYNRLNPAVYQRSWSNGATIVEQSAPNTPVNFSTSWSSVYNDASVSYGAGTGFSLNAMQPSTGLTGDKVLFRLPKADASYTVATGSLSRPAGSGKFAVGDMLDRSNPEGTPDATPTDLDVTLTPDADGKYVIVGNPFPAHLDVEKFLTENSGVLAQKYWLTNDDGPIAGSAGDAGQWVNTYNNIGTSVLLPPYGAFYAELAAADTDPVTVTFTADMQALASATTDAGADTGSQTNGLRIAVKAEGGQSAAVVVFDPEADNAFDDGEDTQLLRGLVQDDERQPYVYTVAGTTAAAVNRVCDVAQIPLGVFAGADEAVTLTFTGLDAVERASLYDAELQSERRLYEGDQLALTGASHGRYFLRLVPAQPTGVADLTTGGAAINIYSVTPGEVVVAATEALQRVEVYDLAGRRVRAVDAQGETVVKVSDLPRGNYVVRAATASENGTAKLLVE